MNKIKRFGTFGKLNEDKQWYINNGYVPAPYANEQELFDKIGREMGPAFRKFISATYRQVPPINVTVERGRQGHYVKLESDEIDDLGVFEQALSSVRFGLFSGREVNIKEVDGELLYKPYIWSTVVLSYNSISGGSNSVNYIVETDSRPSNDVWYDIESAEFFTSTQYSRINPNA